MSLVSGFKYKNVWAKIGKTKLWESKKQKLLVVEIDRTLSFDEHIVSLYRKAGKKLSVLARLSHFMCTNKKSFDESIHLVTVWLLPFNLDVP